MTVPGPRGTGAGHYSGTAQSGDHARARIVTGAAAMGSPAAVGPPARLVSLPKRAVRTFVGRDAQLTELHGLVSSGTGVVAQTVHGLGGVGKTELALQYATRYRGEYRVVWWMLADSPDSVEAGLARLAFRLHPDLQVNATQTEAAGWAVGWLASHDRWLLVLDNVEERADVEPLLGELTNGHILITTRRDVGWQDITDGCIHLDVLDPTTAVALLLGLSEQDDPATAGVLAGELGCLPLALQQAGAYLRQTRTSMAEYLHRLRNQPAEMLASVAVGNDAQRAVARAWSVTIDRITEQTPLALRMLQILSCVAPEALPRDVLTPIAEPGELDAALGALSSYHMITLAHHAVATHRLVQAVTIGQLRRPSADEPDTPKAFAVALRQTVEVLWSAVPSGDPNNAVAEWPQWAALSPHVTALARLCPDDVGGTDLADLLHETAWYFYVQRRLDEAESLHRRVLAVREAAYGPDHPDVAASLHGLAIAVRELGRPAEAEPLHRRALTTFEAAYGPDHPNVATTLNNLANSLRNLSRPADCTVEPWPSVKPPTVRTIPTWQPA